MNFYHGTTKVVAQNILDTEINESVFDVLEYLNYVILEKSGVIQKGYVDNNKEFIRVKWLGKGIYLFDEFNKEEALGWASRYLTPRPLISDCTALKIQLKDIPEDSIFDLFSYSDLKEMKSTIEDDFLEYIENDDRIQGLDLLKYVSIQDAISNGLNELFDEKPYLGGVAVDLYNLINKNKILFIRGIYKKGNAHHNYYDVYYCLKDGQYLLTMNSID